MRSLYNKTAAKVALVYAVVVVGLLIWGDHGADGEGQAWNHLFLGFPWVLVTDDGWFGIILFLMLNTATLYLVTLIYIESFRFDDAALPKRPSAIHRP